MHSMRSSLRNASERLRLSELEDTNFESLQKSNLDEFKRAQEVPPVTLFMHCRM